MVYLTPADVPISDDFAGHKRRNSAEPGTDFATPYGTKIRMAENGTVEVVDNNPGGAEGRRLGVILDDGNRIDYIHLSKNYMARRGQRVGKGTYVAESGGSGFGKNRHYGSHVHVTLRDTNATPFNLSMDFMPFTKAPIIVPQLMPVYPGNPFGIAWCAGLQKIANQYGAGTDIDQRWGPKSASGFAKFLRANWGYVGNDVLGPQMWAAIARWLRARWGYVGNDVPGPQMRLALQRAETANYQQLR